MNNAPSHNKQLNHPPTSNARKMDMQEWLAQQDIPFTNSLLHAELYNLIKMHRLQHHTYQINGVLAGHGHFLLCLPPYHPDLNPVELIWLLKDEVAMKNTTFKLDDVIHFTKEMHASVTPQ
jgi:hypothetical protein